MRILLSGASGYIGKKLIPVLAAAGHEVWALSRNPSKHDFGPNISKSFRWNPLAAPPPRESLEEIDAVIHLAGESVRGRWTQRKKTAIRDTRLTGTANLASGIIAAKVRPKMFISASAMGYYGLTSGDSFLTEDSPPGSDFAAEVAAGWETATHTIQEAGLRVVLLRTSLVLGDEGALPALLPAARLGLGGPLAGGHQWWSWIHQDDVTGLVLHALEHKDVTGPLNITTPNPVPQYLFAKTLGTIVNRPAVLPLPGFVLRLFLGEFADGIIYGTRLSANKALESGYIFKFPTLVSALSNLLLRRNGETASGP